MSKRFTPTGCDALNNPAFQILIPIIDAFYDPPTVAVVPGTVVGISLELIYLNFNNLLDKFLPQTERRAESLLAILVLTTALSFFLIHRDETYETLMQLITQSMQRLLKNTAIEPAPGRFIFDSNSPANTS
ncbi:hypothetical protein RhiirA4_453695 [Rhizophagus irregularis]|uniref:Uncharacterized protein n=1 Tax=Rhizophagus irregularis TaxID=588596 RepID=A0A2I1G135_9GLOM|nr:hypothetical protein RhiirA4_453695 [Rhizophagus irregularis]